VELETVELYSSPNFGAKRAKTLGVVVHSTRGGCATPQTEYTAAVNWLCNPASEVSAHYVIGTDHGVWAQLVADDYEAWHARAMNATHLGVELVQPRDGDEYTPWQYVALARLCKLWSERYKFPLRRTHIVGHDETLPGVLDGKTDPGRMFDWTRFMQILEAL
jgi:N-acetyl-anhydromuramyl-L-alanine amidase AmpD